MESGVQSTTSVAIPFAPCEGESMVHNVSPDSFSEKLKTSGSFMIPILRSPRHEPLSAHALPADNSSVTANTNKSINLLLLLEADKTLPIISLVCFPLYLCFDCLLISIAVA